MVLQHNLTAMFTNKQLGVTTKQQAKSAEKLSTGYRINRAADDAAGLQISENMRRQVRGLNKASKNAEDGISYCQVADGAMGEIDNIVHRVKELCIQGLLTALVTVCTMVFQIPVSATQGYIHLGDSMILLTSVFFGWNYGIAAGGIGSALADLLS